MTIVAWLRHISPAFFRSGSFLSTRMLRPLSGRSWLIGTCFLLSWISAWIAFEDSLFSVRKTRRADETSVLKGPKSQDLGDVPQHAIVSACFTITNQAASTVDALTLSSGCGCTKADIDRRTLLPGESARISAEWWTGEREGASSVDLSLKYGVGERGPASSPLVYRVRGTVVPSATLSKYYLHFTRSERTAQRIIVSSKLSIDITEASLSCDNPAYSVRFIADEHAIEVEYTPPPIITKIRHAVLRVDVPNDPMIVAYLVGLDAL